MPNNVNYNIIYGESDLVVIPKENSKVFEDHPNVKLYKMNCGHVRMLLDTKKLKNGLMDLEVIDNSIPII